MKIFLINQFKIQSIFGIFENYVLEKSNISILVSDSFQKSLQIVDVKFFNQTKIEKVTVFQNLRKLIIKIHFSDKLYKIRRNVIIQNCLLKRLLQISFFYKIYIFCYDLKKHF